jgi:hypothetical protein
MNLHTDKLIDSDETFTIYTEKFLDIYNISKKLNLDKLDFETSEDYYQNIYQCIIDKINSGEESAESLTQKMLLFTFDRLGKVSFVDGIMNIETKNAFLKWSKIEQENYSIIFKNVSKLFDQAVDASNLSETENNDWFLDHLNFVKLFLSAPSINFDDNVKGYNHLYR